MREFLMRLFSSDFMGHGYCYLWQPEIVWLHAISDSMIALSYYVIPFTLVYFVRKRRDLRNHASDGSLDPLARYLPADWCHQGHYRGGIRGHGSIVYTTHTGSRGSPQPGSTACRQPGARKGNSGAAPRGAGAAAGLRRSGKHGAGTHRRTGHDHRAAASRDRGAQAG